MPSPDQQPADPVAAQTIQQLGTQVAMLTWEVNAQIAENRRLRQQVADGEAELARARQSLEAQGSGPTG